MYEARKLLTLKEAEDLTGRKVSTWRRDILLRRIAYVKIGRQVRIPLDVISEMMKVGYRPAIEKTAAATGMRHDQAY
jgi:hypothetical protein